MEKITALCQEAVAITSEDGNVPLHFACQNGHAEVTQTIVNTVSECIQKADESDEKLKNGRITEEKWQAINVKASKLRHSLAATYVH